ncbi:YfcC family protein [Pseudomonas asiatica]|uniref:YfcC family protein n=1 Tax=Pseudomonas asiatica TaxID=2219225 RepID=UPI003839F447
MLANNGSTTNNAITDSPTTEKPRSKPANPIVILFVIVLIATACTYFINSGTFKRDGLDVVPGSYQQLEKNISISDLITAAPARSEEVAHPVSLIETLVFIPHGVQKQAGLIFMVFFIGGMFGILQKAGTIDAGLERLLTISQGNIYVLVPILMLVFSAGSTLLGLSKEFIIIVPLMVAMTQRLGLPNIIAAAIVIIPIKVGYMSSVSNPIALSVAQPLLGLPVFSGLSMRLAAYIGLLILGIVFVLWQIRKNGFDRHADFGFKQVKLSGQNTCCLVLLALGIGFLVFASERYHWKYPELSAYYIGLSVLFAIVTKLPPSVAAEAFLDGMKKVMIAGVLIGMAASIDVILSTGQVLDTFINSLAKLTDGHTPLMSAFCMLFSQMGLDLMIPSTSGQAAITMPIFGPMGQLSGVSPQSTVYAFLLGNGLTNLLTPTSTGLLVLLATAQVGWAAWAKFIIPLWISYLVLALGLLTVAISIGY